MWASFPRVKNLRTVSKFKKGQKIRVLCSHRLHNVKLGNFKSWSCTRYQRNAFSCTNRCNVRAEQLFSLFFLLDFLKVVRMVFWSGVVGPGTNFRSLARSRFALGARTIALKSSTCEQVYFFTFTFPLFKLALNSLISWTVGPY